MRSSLWLSSIFFAPYRVIYDYYLSFEYAVYHGSLTEPGCVPLRLGFSQLPLARWQRTVFDLKQDIKSSKTR